MKEIEDLPTDTPKIIKKTTTNASLSFCLIDFYMISISFNFFGRFFFVLAIKVLFAFQHLS